MFFTCNRIFPSAYFCKLLKTVRNECSSVLSEKFGDFIIFCFNLFELHYEGILFLQVITKFLERDKVYVVADGYLANVEHSFYKANGYTSFTGLQVGVGLEWVQRNTCKIAK